MTIKYFGRMLAWRVISLLRVMIFFNKKDADNQFVSTFVKRHLFSKLETLK